MSYNTVVLVFIVFSLRQALDSVSKGQRKLDLAQRLTGALSSENDRWAENVVDLRADMELLTGDVLLAASFIRCKHSTLCCSNLPISSWRGTQNTCIIELPSPLCD